MATAYEDILHCAESLDRHEQLRLLSDLAEHVRVHASPEARVSILELQGLGKETWQGVDVQEYIDRERASWNG